MPNTWFTADTHFGHAGIIAACNRPFSSVAEMDACMVEAWNATVRPGDHVIHVGDFAMGDFAHAERIFRKLNGRKVLVLGNHDKKNRKLRWAEVHDGIREMSVEDRHVVACHYPMRSWPRAYKGSLHVFGHTHGKLPGTRQSIDVGVDVWGYRPVAFDDIVDAMALIGIQPEERSGGTT